MRTAVKLLVTTTLALGAWAPGAAVVGAAAKEEGSGGRCVPVAERGKRKLGCYVIAREQIGALRSGEVYWHIDAFPDLAAAEAAAGPRSVAAEAFGESWLLTIEERGWRSGGGERVAEIGPLPVEPADAFTAQYMEATFRPGMKSGIAQRSGPEAWHTLSGESCLETRGRHDGRPGWWRAGHRPRGRANAADCHRLRGTTRTRAGPARLVQAGRDAGHRLATARTLRRIDVGMCCNFLLTGAEAREPPSNFGGLRCSRTASLISL
jgi:hypothetical protein